MPESISAAAFNAMQKKAKPSKYGNKKTVVDGIPFDSLAEARRYDELKKMRDNGLIEGLVLQPPFPLVVNGQKIATYKADFLYYDVERQETVVEDVKGMKTPVYRLKCKLVKALHNIDIVEVAA